jgi:uncharacterized membrane protein YeaQ/YmgE (transglycosylase-associated protein family)
MNSPLIGMHFLSFLILLILSASAAAVVHWGFRYRLFQGFDGFLGQWIVAWVGAWLGPAVVGHWFSSMMLWNIYIIPALIGAFAGALGGTVNARIIVAMRTGKQTAPSAGSAG